MKTRKEQMTQKGALEGYSNFMGDDTAYQDWYGILAQSRDSDPLERSNFRVGLKMLGGKSDTVRVERYGHWAVGWIEEIYVAPNSPAYNIACEIEKKLKDYPVLDEEDFSELEWEEKPACERCEEKTGENGDDIELNRHGYCAECEILEEHDAVEDIKKKVAALRASLPTPLTWGDVDQINTLKQIRKLETELNERER